MTNVSAYPFISILGIPKQKWLTVWNAVSSMNYKNFTALCLYMFGWIVAIVWKFFEKLACCGEGFT